MGNREWEEPMSEFFRPTAPLFTIPHSRFSILMSHSVEDIKSESRRLRGSLEQSLADAVTGALREDDQT